MKKVSFDFDQTLSTHEVQEFAKELKGVEKWIVTRRYEDVNSYTKKFCLMYDIPWKELVREHKNLFIVAEECGIKKEHIHFCNMNPKADFFKGKDFLIHLDDDRRELEEIREGKATIAMTHIGDKGWKERIKKVIDEN